MNTKKFKNKTIPEKTLSAIWPRARSSFLPWCSYLAFLTIIGPLLLQPSSLKAMEKEFYKDAKHPLTQPFWKERDLSERLKIKNMEIILTNIEGEIKKFKTKPTEVVERVVKEHGDIDYFKCSRCARKSIRSSKEIPHHNLPKGYILKPPHTDGRSGNEVNVVSYDGNDLVVIKKFTNSNQSNKDKQVEEGMKELMYSLLALKLNPCPGMLKMARVYDAVLCPDNSFSIFIEAARGHDIEHFLGEISANKVIKACAAYLSKFHIENYKLNEEIATDRGKYLKHIAEAYSTLLEKLPGERDQLTGEKKEIQLLSLEGGFSSKVKINNVNSNDIIQVLGEGGHQSLVKATHKNFKENVTRIYRSLRDNKNKKYFLTITHGDAHRNNFFYLDEKIQNESEDSLYHITAIDFASIIKTFGSIGDPAEDIGRFLGSLWDWAAITLVKNKAADKPEAMFKKMLDLQKEFLNMYIRKIIESGIIEGKNEKIFKKTFVENCNFYKLRFYRAVFNVKKDENSIKDMEIKKTVLKSWIWENTRDIKSKNKSGQRPGKLIENIFYYDPPEEFVISTPKGAELSYLAQLQKIFDPLKVQNSSSKATILTGMAGVGKTSLALKYAYDALKNKSYDLIYWVSCKTEEAVLEGYKKLLKKMGDFVSEKMDKKAIIKRVNQHLLKQDRRSLLIYDNAPNSSRFLEFLQGNLLKNKLDILITSRNKAEWKMPFKTGIIELDVFQLDESIGYLQAITGFKKDDKIIAKVAKEMELLPLALSQAAYYILLEGDISKDGFKKYLKIFRKDPTKRNPLEEPRPKITYKNFVYENLCMSEIYGSKAKELLEILKYAAFNPSGFIKEEAFPFCHNLNEKLNQLSALSLIKRDHKGFSLRPLVRLVITNEIKMELDHHLKDSPLNKVNNNSLSKEKKTFSNDKSSRREYKRAQHNSGHEGSKEKKQGTTPIMTISPKLVTSNFCFAADSHNDFKAKFIIKSVDNGQVLDNYGSTNKRAVVVWEQYHGNRQLWNIIKHGQGFIIKSLDNGQVLDNFGAINYKIGVWDEYKGPRQLWNIIKHDQGYLIKSIDNGQVLDNFGAVKSKIGVWDEYRGPRQLWLIIKL